MAEFPPNLDDGELYLPSDIFLNRKIPTRANPLHHHHISYMDDLAHHFTALSLLPQTRPTPSLKTPHNLEVALNSRFRPPVRNHIVNPHPLRPHSYRGLHSGLELESGQRPFSPPLCHIHFPKPTSSTSARVLVQQRQLNRLLVQQNRVLPYQGSGLGFRGGLPRESGGTGVFHPRIINTFTSSGSDSKKKQRKQAWFYGVVMAGARDKEEMQKSEQRKPMKRAVGVSKREDCYYHLPPEMGLPRDWTY